MSGGVAASVGTLSLISKISQNLSPCFQPYPFALLLLRMLTQTVCLPLQSNTILLSPSCPPKSLGQHRFVSPGCCGQIRAAASKRRPLEDGKTKILQNIDVADRTKVQRALEHVQTPVLLFHTTVSAHP